MKMRKSTLTIAVIVLACSSNLHASRMSQPDGLDSGDSYRVMFVTSPACLLYTSPRTRDKRQARVPTSA